MFETAIQATADSGLARSGDIIVITAGVRVNVPGTTNLIKVHLMQ
ncbi:MAG: pyruvate kinase alpha/beta domain-containing protein [Thermoleophilia bacterium]